MNEKIVMFVALAAVLGVSIAGLLNFNSAVGAATKTYDYRDCACLIWMKDYQDNIVTKNPIVTKLNMQTGGMDCQAVCEYYYRGDVDRVFVKGVPGDVYQHMK